MKKILAFLTAFVMFIIAVVGFHNILSGDLKMNNRKFGTWYNNYKDLSFNALSQNMHEDTMPVFGSSEFRHGRRTPFHPSRVFKDSDASLMTIGGPFNQCLNHAITLGALSKQIKKKKVVLLISMTWFYKKGISKSKYALRFSEGNYMALMENPNISKDIKKYIAKRSESLLTEDLDKLRCASRTDDIYVRDSKSALKKKFYDFRKSYVNDKDLLVMQSIMKKYKIKRNSKYPKLPKNATAPAWADLIMQARSIPRRAMNNPYDIDSRFWNRQIKSVYERQKGKLKDEDFSESPEFEDLEVFLKICNEAGIKPMLITLPVNGRWYDYTGLDAKKRAKFNQKINELGEIYHANVVDFSKYDYKPNIMKDTVHPRGEGWVRINEAIYKFYKQN